MGNTTSGIFRTYARALQFICVASAMVLYAAPAGAQQPLYLEDFSQIADQGFGDFHNSMARASQWWNGKLYVGGRFGSVAGGTIYSPYLAAWDGAWHTVPGNPGATSIAASWYSPPWPKTAS